MTLFRDPKGQKGFTLIELLVVISIIGLLSTIVLGAVNSARQKAQNVQIIATFRQLQTALELYYNQNGQYPSQKTSLFAGVDVYDAAGGTDFQTTLNPLVTGSFISKIPTYPTWPNNTPSLSGGAFEYETDLADNIGTYWDGTGTYGCGNRSSFGKGYFLALLSPISNVNLPHLSSISASGVVTDKYNDGLFAWYYYCVTSP